jgi:hypothetical protein
MKSVENLLEALEERLDPEFWGSSTVSVSVQCRISKDRTRMYRIGQCSWRPSLEEALEELAATMDRLKGRA